MKVTLVDANGAAIPDTDGNAADAHVSAIAPADGIYCAKVETASGAGLLARYVLAASLADATAPHVASVAGLAAQGGLTATAAEPLLGDLL